MSETGRPSAAAIGRATGRSAQSPGTLTRNRVAPVAGSYSPGTPTPMVETVRVASDRLCADRTESRDDRVRAIRRRGRDLAAVERPPRVVVLDDHPLDVRAAEVEAEVTSGGLAVGHADQVSPVTRV